MVKPIPDGYHSVTPYLILSAAGDAIAFYKKALGATEVMRMDDPGGKIHHAEISIGNSRIMLADEHPEVQAFSPKTIGGSRSRSTSMSMMSTLRSSAPSRREQS
jgi:PhnB protein